MMLLDLNMIFCVRVKIGIADCVNSYLDGETYGVAGAGLEAEHVWSSGIVWQMA